METDPLRLPCSTSVTPLCLMRGPSQHSTIMLQSNCPAPTVSPEEAGTISQCRACDRHLEQPC